MHHVTVYSLWMLFHSLGFLEAELKDAKERYLMDEQEGRLAVEQLRGAKRKKADAVRKSMDLKALCQQREKHVTKSLTVLFTQLLDMSTFMFIVVYRHQLATRVQVWTK